MKQTPKKQDPFGFVFWLKWIITFAGSFIIVAGVWTYFLPHFLGTSRGLEFTLTWSVCVFGCWFLLLVPFMRKKEQIWKRLNQDQEKAVNAWLGAMSIFIGLLIFSHLFWSWKYKHLITESQLNKTWLKAVFGSWLLLIMPFLIFMYRKADQIYKIAMERQLGTGPKFQSAFLEKEKRLLTKTIREELKNIEPTLDQGHVVTATLSDGRRIANVFIFNATEILGVYDYQEMDFMAADIISIEKMEDDQLPAYDETKWLRLDGRA